MTGSFRNNFIGDRAFYKTLLLVAIPIMLQNALTNVVGLLDNIMVGQLGTDSMAGVSIANNLMFVYIIVCFGAVSGAGIFSAQYFGKSDYKGMAAAFRMKIYICLAITVITLLIFSFWGKDLISLYIHDSGDDIGDVVLTSEAAWDYLYIMLFGLPFLGLTSCYSSSVRECKSTIPPMIAGMVAVFTDLVLNYLLIFGKFGFPVLGVRGAAIATVISRIVECLINVFYAHLNRKKLRFIKYAYRTFKIPLDLLKGIAMKGLPLVVNETLWVLSLTIATQCYSTRGIVAMAALNMQSSFANVFNVFFLAMGNSVGIIIGPMLGAGKIKEAKETTKKLVFSTFVICLFTSALMAVCAKPFPNIYNTEPEVKALAFKLILISSCFIPFQGICNSSYFAMRSGGKTWLTFLFDSGLQWILFIPLAYFFSNYTDLSILKVFAIASTSDAVKCLISLFFLIKVNWAQNIVSEKES